MPAADATQVPAVQPDPPRAAPEHVGRVLSLLRTFITYGRKLADTLRHHAGDPHDFPGFFSVASIFRTRDVPLILDRIARGLFRAAALEDRLNRFAARGRDLTVSPVRTSSARNPSTTGSAAATDNQPDDPAPPADPAAMPPPDDIPADDIIARDRRRPIGSVLVDICHDLGIAPDQVDRATWDELLHYVIGYGGSLVTLLFKRPLLAEENPDIFQGYFTGPIPTAIAFAAWPELPSPYTPPPMSSGLPQGCTGPP